MNRTMRQTGEEETPGGGGGERRIAATWQAAKPQPQGLRIKHRKITVIVPTDIPRDVNGKVDTTESVCKKQEFAIRESQHTHQLARA